MSSSSVNIFYVLPDIFLVILVLTSAVTDFAKKKIYNYQTYPAMIIGLFIGFLVGGLKGLLLNAAGLGTGIILLLPFFLVRGLGAGDVKLLGAIGALKGAEFVIWTMFYTGLIGGAVAMAVIIWRGTFYQTWLNIFILIRHPLGYLQSPPSSKTETDEQALQYIPYGIIISAGCLLTLVSLQL